MKEIGKEKFGLLYDKLYEHLTNNEGNLKTVGIEQGPTHEILSRMWQEGRTWETIVLVIAYHYSRTETVMLRFSDISTLIFQGSSFKEIQKLLGIKVEGITGKGDAECVIERNEFDKEFGRIWELVREKKKISPIISVLGVTKDKGLLSGYWKQGKKWETVTTIIIVLRLRFFGEVEVETEYGRFRFKKGTDTFGILETIENSVIKP